MAARTEKPYFTYLLRCEDGSNYTGITTDLDRRAEEHLSERTNSRYTQTHRGVKMEAAFYCENRSAASKLEYRIKRLTHREKEWIIREHNLSALEQVINISRYNYVDPNEQAYAE